jgi:HTH-type transcriptional repressor of puuD
MFKVGNRITQLRNEHNISITALAKQAGIAQSTLSYIESGENSPTVETVEKLCAAMGVTLAEFFDITIERDNKDSLIMSAVNKMRKKGLSDKAILSGLMYIGDTFTELVMLAKENPTAEELDQAKKLEEKLKDPGFIPPWERNNVK